MVPPSPWSRGQRHRGHILEDKDSLMPPLIYSEDSNNDYSLRNPPPVEPTLEPGPPSEKTTEEPTSEPDSDALSEPSVPMREDTMGHLSPKDIVRYQKVSYPPMFATLEERTKEAPWIYTCKIRILGQDKRLGQEKTS